MIEDCPSALPRSEGLRAAIAAAFRARGADEPLRTHHVGTNGQPRFANRLALESSPYLLQHAHNPVDWYPWGEEAFAAARSTGRPIFLSVGYSTCHWCHVMERESFEDLEIAAALNARYVAVKVDREERPDVDQVYMTAVQMMTGHGGWPMSVWLTADARPFFAGTYFPARDGDRGARHGFLTLLHALADACQNDPDRVASQGERVAAALAHMGGEGGHAPSWGAGQVSAAREHFLAELDPVHGGFGGAPKFPRASVLDFMLREAAAGSGEARHAVELTADHMARGGLYDHLGGGFHRYSTDAWWLVPHFEKMLYDNAQLAAWYLDASVVLERPELADVARGVLDYLDREMSAPGGGFYSASDADSEGHEGSYFVWTLAELQRELGEGEAERFARVYGASADGNWEGANILHLTRPWVELARVEGIGASELASELSTYRARLLAARGRRVAPAVDDKVLASWNGLAIAAFAKAAFAWGESKWLARAEAAGEHVWRDMQRGGRLLRVWRRGIAKQDGLLDDYAFVAAGYLELFQASADARWLERARALMEIVREKFRHPDGGYHVSPDDGEPLLVRDRPWYDGAEPSGNSVAIANALALALLTDDDGWRREAEAGLRAAAAAVSHPAAVPKLLCSIAPFAGDALVAVVVTPEEPGSDPLAAALRRSWLPGGVRLVVSDAQLEALGPLVPFLEGRRSAGRSRAFICRHGRCGLPIEDPAALSEALRITERNVR